MTVSVHPSTYVGSFVLFKQFSAVFLTCGNKVVHGLGCWGLMSCSAGTSMSRNRESVWDLFRWRFAMWLSLECSYKVVCQTIGDGVRARSSRSNVRVSVPMPELPFPVMVTYQPG